MFDDRLEAVRGDRCALADLAAEVELQQRLWGCRKLVIAAAWADAHSEVDHPDGLDDDASGTYEFDVARRETKAIKSASGDQDEEDQFP